ncbi:MAG TPA: putative sulfate exporter family transporter [Bacillales bacterium]|nr:putative sulfate exporter family transporter [Bacillales bacterium]
MNTESYGNVAKKKTAPEPEKEPSRSPWTRWLGGIGFTFLIALIGYGVAQIPGPDRVGSMACSIILAVIFRQIWGYPEVLRPGIEFSGKKLLRYAIVLYGLKLNIDVILNQGLPLLARDAFTIVFAITMTLLIAKWMKADLSLSMLLGVGTGVCGASAIAAVSSILKSKEEDTAIGVGIIALMGTVFALIYTVVRPFLPLSGMDYGVWSGISLHEIAHVALAAAPAGQDPLAIALLAKLGRVFLLVPLSFILMFWMKKRSKGTGGGETKTPFPWFLIGFIIMSLIGSYVVGVYVQVPKWILSGIGNLSHFILTAAMVGLGLNVSFKALRTKALRPLIAMTIISVLLSGITFLSVWWI